MIHILNNGLWVRLPPIKNEIKIIENQTTINKWINPLPPRIMPPITHGLNHGLWEIPYEP